MEMVQMDGRRVRVLVWFWGLSIGFIFFLRGMTTRSVVYVVTSHIEPFQEAFWDDWRIKGDDLNVVGQRVPALDFQLCSTRVLPSLMINITQRQRRRGEDEQLNHYPELDSNTRVRKRQHGTYIATTEISLRLTRWNALLKLAVVVIRTRGMEFTPRT